MHYTCALDIKLVLEIVQAISIDIYTHTHSFYIMFSTPMFKIMDNPVLITYPYLRILLTLLFENLQVKDNSTLEMIFS